MLLIKLSTIATALLLLSCAVANAATLDDKRNAAISDYLITIIPNAAEREAFDNSLGDTVLEGDDCDALTKSGKLTKACKRALRDQLAIERSR